MEIKKRLKFYPGDKIYNENIEKKEYYLLHIYIRFWDVTILDFIEIDGLTYAIYLNDNDDSIMYGSLVKMDINDNLNLVPYFRILNERIYYNQLQNDYSVIDGRTYKFPLDDYNREKYHKLRELEDKYETLKYEFKNHTGEPIEKSVDDYINKLFYVGDVDTIEKYINVLSK